MARLLLEKYFFNRNVPIGPGYTRTNMEWKMRKDHSVMENRSEREGSKINPCSITHFPALAALQDQPNIVLSMDVSSKGSRNKIFLQLCQATLKKKSLEIILTILLRMQDSKSQESTELRFLLQPPSFAVFPAQTRHEDIAERSQSKPICFILCSSNFEFFKKYYWQHCFYYFNHLRSHVGL